MRAASIGKPSINGLGKDISLPSETAERAFKREFRMPDEALKIALPRKAFEEETPAVAPAPMAPVAREEEFIRGRGIERLAEMLKSATGAIKKVAESEEFERAVSRVADVVGESREKVRELMAKEMAKKGRVGEVPSPAELVSNVRGRFREERAERREKLAKVLRIPELKKALEERRARKKLEEILGVKPEIVEI